MKTRLTSLVLATACLVLLCATSIKLQAATLTVINTADSGAGTLRAALASAADGDTITFGVTGTITLTSGELAVSKSVAIVGPGATALTVSGNNARRVFNVTGGNVTISGMTVANGLAAGGAGIYASTYGSVIAISGCVITNNNANSNADGGGIWIDTGVTMTVSNCTISGNTALGGFGGGVENLRGVLTVTASTLNGNSALNAGGIYNAGPYGSATLTINTSTFNGNSAIYFGGGIFSSCNYGSATVRINASTFNGNSATTGGGIGIGNVTGTLEIGDTIMKAGTGENIYNSAGTVTSDGYNLSSDNGSGFLNQTGDQINTDPKLGPLQNNGGLTWTCALLPGSPAIDQGKRNAITNLVSNTDQRGLPRPIDSAAFANATGGDGSDIGAYEIQQGFRIPITSLADSGPGTLRDVLANAANGDTVYASLAGTITLSTGALDVPSSVNLVGPGASVLTVSGNNASGVFNIAGTNVTISGLTIADGLAVIGAGIYSGGGSGSVLGVSGCVITNNIAGYNGGGIFNSPGVALSVSNCLIAGNWGYSSGGGIYNDHASVTVNASTISANSASYSGGGIFNDGKSSGGATVVVNASTFSGNAGLYGTGGGGIFNDGHASGSATLTVNASTFNGDSAPSGSGGSIFNWGYSDTTTTLGDTILNAAGGNIYNYGGTVISAGYNLSSDNGGGLLTATGDQINTDPKLGPLQNNGGPTPTCALLAGSPALDQGKANAVSGMGLATDERGFARPTDFAGMANATGGDGSDIGAFEAQVFTGNTPRLTGAKHFGDGSFQFGFTNNTAGATFTVLGATNVALPLANWTVLGGAVKTAPNQFQFTDPQAAGVPQQFYRVSSP